MRTTHSPATAAGRTVGRVLRAGFSLLVLAAALAGLPALLAWVTPVIWASTHDDLTHLLDRQDTGAAFLVLLVAIGWIGWAQFTFCAVRELLAQLRGRTWQAPRGFGASQRAAALLIGSILVLLPASSALASDAQAAQSAGAARLPGHTHAPQTAGTGQATASTASTSAASSHMYTVRETKPAQSLWSIAERELGNGERWREIASLNEGRTMADGGIFRANSFLQPGWQLQMPDSGVLAGGVRTQLRESAPAASRDQEHVVSVRSGDSLSEIAEKELGDGNDWPDLFEASKGKPQPDGLPAITDPDVIYAGQRVTVPGTQLDQTPQHHDQGEEPGSQETTPPATQKPGSEQKPSHDPGDTQAPEPSHTTSPPPQSSAPSAPASRPAQQPGQEQASPSATDSSTPEPTTNASPSAASPSASAEPSGSAASSPTTAPAQTPASHPASSPMNRRTLLGAGALLAAAVTGALALRRTLQRRRRKPGETIAIAPETLTAEATLAAAAEPGGAARLDVALRTLAHQMAQDNRTYDMPGLRAARIGARSLQVLPEDLTLDPQSPFVSGKAGWWVLPDDSDLLSEDDARQIPAPYPSLVTIGSTKDGDLLLLNLAQLPALLLDGNPVHITEVCTSLALELGMSPWASDVEVVTVGFGEDLPQLLPTARIAHMRQPAHALRDLSERLLEAHQIPESQHQPYVLLCASPPDADTAWEFADVIDKAGTVPVTLIAPASATAAHFPEAEILNASLSEPQTLDYTGTDITVQRLEHAAYLQITTALKVSGQPAHPAEGSWQNVPDELDSQQWPEPAAPEESTAPTSAAAPSPSPAAETDVSGEVFPALLAATTDPSALHLLPCATASPQATDQSRPDAEAATAAAPIPHAAADAAATVEAAEADEHENTAEERTPPQAQESETHDAHTPEIRVLGPVEVTGVDSTGHGPRMAQLAALLFFRPGRSANVLCADMDPISPWSTSTLNARLQGLRRSLGSDPAGNPYVPRRSSGEDPYQLAPGVRCDWIRFLQLVEHALPLGPAGLTDLEKALTLVRGRPFGGKPLPWAEPHQQEMVTRIIDVAHTVAAYRTPAGPHHDLSAARQAVATGLDVDDTAELLYRDWLRIEHAAGNRSGLHTAITRIQQINQALDCSLEMETEQLINHLLNGKEPPGQQVS